MNEAEWRSRGNYSEIVDCVISRIQMEHLKKRIQEIFQEAGEEYIFRNQTHRNIFHSLFTGRKSESLCRHRNYAAAVFLLSADGGLWERTKRHVADTGIYFDRIRLGGVTLEQYILFHAAKDVYNGTKHATTKVVINFHYKRGDNDYDEWSLWLWEDNGAGTDNAFSGVDEQGAYFSMTAGSKTSKIGFIVRTSDWDKEGDSDRFVDVSDVVSGTIDVYITSGVDEVNIVRQDDVVTSVKIIEANYISETKVGIRTTGAITNTNDIKVCESSGTEITVSNVEQQNSEKEYTLILAEPLDVFRGYYIVFQDITYTIKMPNVYSGADFEDAYTYNGNDLGAVWTAGKTTFKVWAPTADAVKVCLYENGTAGDGSAKEELPMCQRDQPDHTGQETDASACFTSWTGQCRMQKDRAQAGAGKRQMETVRIRAFYGRPGADKRGYRPDGTGHRPDRYHDTPVPACTGAIPHAGNK